MHILLFVILSILILLVIDLLSYSLGRTGWSRFVSTFLLFFAQIIATEFALGTLSALNATNLVACNLLVTGTIAYLLSRRYGASIYRKYASSLKRSSANLIRTLRHDPLFLILLVLGAGFVGWIVFLGILFPGMDYDGNSYHLTFIANVIQNGNFFDPPSSLSWLIGYPKGGEFIQLWSALITNSDIFTDLAQVPFLLLGVYALYQIAVRLGADKRHALFAALLFFFLPVVLNQLKTTYVDVMLSSLFFTAIALVIKERLGKLDLVLLGVAFSLIISIKSTGLLFVLALAPLLLWKLYSNRNKKTKNAIKQYVVPLALVVAPMAFGFYWYIKNLVLYHTPIYPFGFKLLGLSIFPGKTYQEFATDAVSQTSLPEGCLQKLWFVWTEQKDWFGCLYNYDTNYAGFGPIWFIILVPATVVAIYFAIKKRNYLFMAVSAATLVIFLAYPANFYTRYTMFIAGVGIVALGLVLTNIHKVTANLVKILTIALAAVVIFTNFVLCNYAPLTVKQQFKEVRAGSVRGSVYSHFPGQAYTFLEAQARSGDVVAYDSKPFFIYPLWKPDFSNDVLYVPANDPDTWYKEIRTKSVDYVFTTLTSKENKWAIDHLKSIYKDEMYEIYEVR